MKFKVGDRVRVYQGWPKPFDGQIAAIGKEGLLSIIEEGFYSAHEDSPFHPKQCRKLVKKERRRVFIYNSAFEALTKCDGFTCVSDNPMVFVEYDPKQINKRDNDRLVEFIEVRRK